MCKVLGVPRSTYYKSFDTTESNRSIENKEYKERIKRIHEDSKGIYGAPKIHKVLENEGSQISLKRVQRLMSDLDIKSVIIKKYRPYSNKKVIEGKENVLNRDFTTTTINEKWVGDITYIHTLRDGWCYLASVLDLHTKKIIGYSLSKKMTNDLVVTALKNAYSSQKPDNTVIFHSDLGSQYTSTDLKDLTQELNMIQSFSKKGCPYDNACIESFHAIIKKEEVYRTKYVDFQATKIAIFKYIEGWYNRKRIHGSIGYKTPEQYEMLARKIA